MYAATLTSLPHISASLITGKDSLSFDSKMKGSAAKHAEVEMAAVDCQR